MKIYLAAPLFTQAQRRWLRSLAQIITAKRPDWTVFLPQDEAEIRDEHGAPDCSAIFGKCLEGLDAADIVLAILDGVDVDSGTSFEIGWAYAKNKKIYGVLTDFRYSTPNEINAMLFGCCTDIIYCSAVNEDLDYLVAQIVDKMSA
jgi:nucleoside 2-deoxyribosyltransferase